MGKKAIAAILIFSAFLRLWISDFKLVFLDYDAFYHARIARMIYETKALPLWDYQELGGIPHYYPPFFHILIAFFKIFLPLDFLEIASFLNVAFGVLAIFVLYKLCSSAFNERTAAMASLIYATLPAIVIRTGLIGRPLGISMFFAVLAMYVFYLYQKNEDKKFLILGVLVMILFSLTHSLFVIVSFVITSASLAVKKFRPAAVIAAVFLFALAYYFDFIFTQYNFSLGYTMEYLPFIRAEKFEFLFQGFDFWVYLGKFLSFANFGLGYLPLTLYGAYLIFKKDRFLGIIMGFGFISAFIKTNIFLMFIFALAISTAVAIDRIMAMRKQDVKYGWALGIWLFLFIIGASFYMNYKYHGEKVEPYVPLVKQVLEGTSFNENNLILSNNIDIGHEIAYYSKASVFLSDLTDAKKWTENYEIYNRLYNTAPGEAIKILDENKIDYILIIENPREEVFPWIKNKFNPGFTFTSKNTTIKLYQHKRRE